MTTLEFWVGCLVVASVRRNRREMFCTQEHPVRVYYARHGGYRSLSFKCNSWTYHQRKEAQRSEIKRLTRYRDLLDGNGT